MELTGASWYGGPGARANGAGLSPAGRWVVRIPEVAMPAGYLGPEDWAEAENPAGHWSLGVGDILALGHGLPEPEELALTGLGAVSGRTECFVVTGVRDNRRGAAVCRHLRAEGGG